MDKKLRVAFYNFFPMANKKCPNFPEFHASTRCPMPGLAVEILKLVADYLNMTIEVELLGDIDIRSPVWEKTLKRVEVGELDLVALTLEKTAYRAERFDFSYPLYEVSTKLAVKQLDSSLSNFFDFFKVYGVQIWILMGLAFLVFTGIGSSVRFVEYKLRLRNKLNIFEFLWKMLRLQLIQNEGGMEFRLLAGSISMITFSFLQCAIIVSLFQGWILSSMVKTKQPKPFHLEHLPWLLENKHYSFVTNNIHRWYYEELNVSYQTPFYEFRRAMTNNPLIEVPTQKDVFDKVYEGNKIMVIQDDEMISFKADQYCELIYMESPFPIVDKHFIMKKGHPLLPDINRAIEARKMLILRAKRKYFTYRTHSRCDRNKFRERPLPLTPYYSVFLLFSVGIFLALFAFIVEVVRKNNDICLK